MLKLIVVTFIALSAFANQELGHVRKDAPGTAQYAPIVEAPMCYGAQCTTGQPGTSKPGRAAKLPHVPLGLAHVPHRLRLRRVLPGRVRLFRPFTLIRIR
jgi:hypothetical protein